jgi:hypothetical protein
MFTMTLSVPRPEPAVLARARDELASLIRTHSRIRRTDLLHRREIWVASQSGPRSRADRFRNADIARSETSLRHLLEMEVLAEEKAAEQLPALLRELGGLVRAYDLGGGCLGIRVAVPPSDLESRALLLPEVSRRSRIQLQVYGPDGRPPGPAPAYQVCLGIHGDRFVDLALDRMHLPTLVLALVSYVRTNVEPVHRRQEEPGQRRDRSERRG